MNTTFGQYMKKLRTDKKMSLNDVFQKTGITTSRLSKLERNMMPEPPAEVLCKLADCYSVDIINLLIAAGFLKEPPNELQFVGLLQKDEFSVVQDMINALTKGRRE